VVVVVEEEEEEEERVEMTGLGGKAKVVRQARRRGWR